MTAPARRYQPTDAERAAVGRYFADKEKKPPLPTLKVKATDGVGHNHGWLMPLKKLSPDEWGVAAVPELSVLKQLRA